MKERAGNPEAGTELTHNPASRETWFTPASEKTRPLQEVINRTIAEQRRANPDPHPERADPGTLRGKFGQPSGDEPALKSASHEEMRERTKAEAQAKRENIPPQYRAEPYEQEQQHSRPEPEQPKTGNSEQPHASAARRQWKEQAQPGGKLSPQEQPPKSARARMSEAFNAVSSRAEVIDHSGPATKSGKELDYEL